eukprot:CAMPEP_0173331910 /NCGR_PEP_ID=MMETSP1144-20121109/4061_1 /TAXON_ID=483371 /ORGANISM="non described non described, Strain CCMP2298" /LENGTH=272 /DNA_ID=CAMNT_0014276739 /DNA_START=277 /DNA_END=1095 /DNA_ORIENTATION=+
MSISYLVVRRLPSALFSFVIALALVAAVSAHGRWKCPSPRDALDEAGNHIRFDNTANKYAACGPESGKWGFGKVTSLKPGWTTITWEESISHTGSPFRISILDETETTVVVLLDHIPHNEDSQPIAQVEATYTEYSMSLLIPDIKCDKCTLQFLYAMTDKTVKCGTPVCYYNPQDAACKGSTDPDAETCAGAPNDTPCVAEGECFSNYHSCSDVVLLGSQPLSALPYDSQPADWPFKSMKMQNYGAEVGQWSGGWLQGVPSNYTTPFDNLRC